MSRLDELLQQYCPDGVEYKQLSSVVNVERGKRVVREQLPPDGRYVVYQNSLMPLGFLNEYNYSGGTSFIIGAGAAGEIGYSYDDFWAADDCYPLVCSDGMNGRFLYHVLLSKSLYISSQVRRGSIPRLSRTVIEKMIVPVPPLLVQAEIVRILDQFTKLTAELTAELTARKEQYAFYRASLLNFDDPSIEWTTLGSLGKICMCKRIMKAETTSSGDVPFYKIGTFGGQANAYISYETFERYRKLYSYPKKGDVLISAAGTIGRTVVFDGAPAYFQDSNIVWIDNDEKLILNSFLKYYYQLQPWHVSTGGTIARLYNDNISRAKVPLLSIEDQKRIVDILDRFDALCTDISSGLPAEIAARQKQYEYYRDKLLSFSSTNA